MLAVVGCACLFAQTCMLHFSAKHHTIIACFEYCTITMIIHSDIDETMEDLYEYLVYLGTSILGQWSKHRARSSVTASR